MAVQLPMDLTSLLRSALAFTVPRSLGAAQILPLDGYESQLYRHMQSNLNNVKDEEDDHGWIEHVNEEQ